MNQPYNTKTELHKLITVIGLTLLIGIWLLTLYDLAALVIASYA